ncbi:putative metalloprotease CJM1_0395 family protein [Aquipseudomonas guryensis]|uniref:putative metalloprotease CJM1_0395 family protein n=1 Tax=Aquipseudomonas guryensis TaxID=2759165 RepID=UPI001F48C5C3
MREEADSPGNGEDAKPSARETQQVRQEQLQVAELASRDREVRAHEQAHAAVGGAYAGAPAYTYKRGPDGKSYVVSGEVSIDVSPIPNDPQATLRKMEVVQRAALAPAEPSSQDRRVAAQAQALAAQARTDLAQQRREEAAAASEERRLLAEEREQEQQEKEKEEKSVQQPPISAPSLDLYRGLSQLQSPEPTVDLLA